MYRLYFQECQAPQSAIVPAGVDASGDSFPRATQLQPGGLHGRAGNSSLTMSLGCWDRMRRMFCKSVQDRSEHSGYN